MEFPCSERDTLRNSTQFVLLPGDATRWRHSAVTPTSSCFAPLLGGATKLAQLECALQKQALMLTELQTTLGKEETSPPQAHELAAKVERLDMQLAELSSQVQADGQARALLPRLSGSLIGILHPPPPPPTPTPCAPRPKPTPFPQITLSLLPLPSCPTPGVPSFSPRWHARTPFPRPK